MHGWIHLLHFDSHRRDHGRFSSSRMGGRNVSQGHSPVRLRAYTRPLVLCSFACRSLPCVSEVYCSASSEVQSVRLSRSSCMMRVESLYDSSSSVSSSAIALSKACFARVHASSCLACTS